MKKKVYCINCRWLKAVEYKSLSFTDYECRSPRMVSKHDHWLREELFTPHPATSNKKNDCLAHEEK